jgi:AraC-like DNA-binding protein
MSANLLALIASLLACSVMVLFALGAALAIRDARGIVQGRVLAALLVSLAFLSITILPDAQLLPKWLRLSAMAAGVPNLGLLWWFCLALLHDHFRIGAREWAGLIALAVVPAFYLLEQVGIGAGLSATVHQLGSIPPALMIAHVVWIALAERGGDLVEPRRRVRLWLVFALLATLVVSLLTESLANQSLALILRYGLGVLPVQLALLFWLTRISPEQLQFKAAALVRMGEPRIDPKDAALHRRLVQAIAEEQVYLRPGLTIEALAGLLKAPTHQLRHLINSGLGFRNFAAFLNGYRLDHAKAALADEERARETVLAIAYEAGFASLQSFNRVFKEVLGQTPTEFRAAALAVTTQN